VVRDSWLGKAQNCDAIFSLVSRVTYHGSNVPGTAAPSVPRAANGASYFVSMDKKGRFEDLIARQKEKLNCSRRYFT
jgi:hypothetical protein